MEFRVLGPVVVTDAGASIDVGGPRQRRLLAALVMHANRAVPTDELIEIVFEGAPPAGATTTIRTYIARLRKALGDGSGVKIDTIAHGYALCLDPIQIDAHQFEQEVELGRRQLGDHDTIKAAGTLRKGLAHWQGRAYGEFAAEQWVRGEAARLDELRIDADEQLIDAQLACGLTDDVIAELRRLIAAEPLRERFRCQLMLALHRAGRHAEALRAFEEYRSELIELGLEPTGELVALERSVAVHDPALQLATPAGRALRGYRLGASLGAGRHGEVFRAVQPVVGREVAIKVIRGELADSPAFIRRFDARAQSVSKLEHAHIVPLHDYWREPNAAYLVMRLMPTNLSDRLGLGPLEPDEVAKLIRQLGSALCLAHREGVVHGDLRPSNVLLDADDNFYLSDFRLTDIEIVDTEQREPSGFIAPEVRGWQRPVAKSDQFALAVLVAHALTGALPFGQRGVASPDDHFPSVHAQRPSVPAEVDEVLWRAAAWDSDDRYDDIATFADQLTLALGSPRHDHADDTPVNPFRGLAPFTEADAAWFFGRDLVIDQVLQRLGQDRSPLVTVIGASGSGKSSVVRAGVVPRLRHGAVAGSADWLITTMIPGDDPFASLTAAIRSIATVDHTEVDHDRRVASIIGAAVPQEHHVLLVIDQMEELFTLAPNAVCDAFIAGLEAALDTHHSQLRVLATLRADYSDRPLRYSRFGRLLAGGAVPLVAMNVAELDEAIREPARRGGVEIEPALVTELIADLVDQPSALPLLQFTLTQLFERGGGRAMTLESYRALGGVEAAVARRADEVYCELSPEARHQTRQMFLRLIAVDEAGVATRRRVTKTELAGLGIGADSLDGLLESFGSARLLAFDRDHDTRAPTVELAHESLISQWPRLSGWVSEAGEGLRIRSQLTIATRQWVSTDRDAGDLYRGARLEQVVEWADDEASGLTTTETEFLHASIAARDAAEAADRQHIEQQARSNRRLRVSVVGVGIALVVAVAAGLLAALQWNRADQNADRAETRELVAASASNLDVDPDLSVLVALEAVRSSDSETQTEAVRALHLAVLDHRLIGSVPIGTAQPGTATFAPDGMSFATIGEDPLTVDVWSTESRQRRFTLSGHTEPVTSVSYSPDGATIATTGVDGTVRLWQADTGDAGGLLGPDEGDAYTLPSIAQVAFSPDGSSIAAIFYERTFIWDIESGDEIMRLRSGDAPAGDPTPTDRLAFHPDGSMLVTTENMSQSSPPSALLWDLTTERVIHEFTGHTATVTDVEFSPDGRLLYTASRDGTVRIWNVDLRSIAGTFTGHDSEVLSVDISRDGTRVASAGTSGALVWDTDTFEIVARLSGHVGPVDNVELAPDGSSALTSSGSDGTAKLWSLAASSELMSLSGRIDAQKASSGAGALAFDPVGNTVTVAGGDQLTSWTFPSGEPIATLPAPGSDVSTIVWSPDGAVLAAAGSGGTVVYEVGSGAVVARPIVDTLAASVTFAPDGQQLVSTGPGAKLTGLDDGTARSLVSAWLWTYDAAFSLDGDQLAVAHTEQMHLGPAGAGGDGVVEVLDTETFSIVAMIPVGPSQAEHTDQVIDLEFSPDGSLLVTASKDASAIIWSVDDYQEVQRLVGHTNELTAAAFDPEGTALATASLDETIRVWDVATGRNVLTLPSRRSMTDVAYSPDGRYLAATDETGHITVYLLDTDDLVAEAQRRLTRDLTDAECLRYLHDEICPTD